ncbi:MAG: hypothetical protein H7256_02430 [Bdellovibrio sp.]|nr:hypothetical protein [Bdellovibrio sp.]
MKSLLLTLSFLVFAGAAHAENGCGMRTQGIDTWPWKQAQPLKDIQGIWKMKTDEGDVFFKFRISANMANRKILVIDKIIDGNCAKPVASGVGYIAVQEKNTVRALISDANLQYQLKLALFDTEDLSSSLFTDVESCGQQVIGISVLQVIGRTKAKDYEPPRNVELSAEPENMMLKKVSNSLDSICKKPTGH